MEYSLRAIYNLIRGYINLLLQLEVTSGVSIGGIIFSILLLCGIFTGLGLVVNDADKLKVEGITAHTGRINRARNRRRRQ